MAIIVFEGFDNYGFTTGRPTTDPEEAITGRSDVWSGVTLYPVYKLRDAGQAVTFRGAVGSTGTPPPQYTAAVSARSHIFAGIAFQADNVLNADDTPDKACWLLAFQSGTNNGIRVKTDSATPNFVDLIGEVGSESFTIGGVSQGIWYYLEVELRNEAGVGTHYEVWLNGVSQTSGTTTPASILPDFTQLGLGANIRDAPDDDASFYRKALWLDDFYFLDNDAGPHGAAFAQRLGPISIRPMELTGDGAGTWAASSGGAKYEDVKEIPGPSDKDGTFISTSAAPSNQRFTVQGTLAEEPVLAVLCSTWIKQENIGAGVGVLSFQADNGTLLEVASSQPIPTAYRWLVEPFTALPGGSPMNRTNIEACQWGLKVSHA